MWLGDELVRVTASRWHKEQVRIKIAGIDTIDEAEALRGRYLEIDSSSRGPLEEGEYYVTDLVGLLVVDEDGTPLGRVDAVIESPAQDLLRFGEVLVPFVAEFVREIDPSKGTITVRLLPGMLNAD